MVALGISLGTNTAGIAIVEYSSLIEWRTHSFRAVWSDAKADNIIARISEYIPRYKVSSVTIKLPPPSHQPQTIQHLLRKLRAECERHGCTVKLCTKRELKRFIGAQNTRHMMELVVKQFPELVPDYERALKSKTQYYKKAFQAVIAAQY